MIASAPVGGANRRYLWAAMEAATLPNDWRWTLWREGEKHQHETAPLSYQDNWLHGRLKLLRRVQREAVQLDATNDDVAERARALADECWDSIQREGDDGGARVIVQKHARREWPGSARATCSRWWKRCLNARTDAVTEEAARALGHVGGRARSYVSEQTHVRKIGQRRRNQGIVDAARVDDGNGETCDLKIAVQASVANPQIRRAELMTRCRGLEELAVAHGLTALFVTTTNASRFHPVRADGSRNELWHGASVRDAQADQLGKWARVRARWAKHALRVYGLRVSEPHKSGTPHWHLLMFVEPSHVRRVVAHLLRVWREDDRNIPSRASLKHRVKVDVIDASKGTATGYVAKYVSKNIDGHGLEDGDKSNARRVRSWASAHRIRQFQFFGGPPVGVWREARRIADADVEKLPELSVIADVVAAVNRRNEERADWAQYVRLNGGLWCRRRDRPMQLHYLPEPEIAAYGEVRHCRLFGVRQPGLSVQTRHRRWKIVWGKVGSDSRTRFNNRNQLTRSCVGSDVSDVEFSGAFVGTKKMRDYHDPNVLYESKNESDSIVRHKSRLRPKEATNHNQKSADEST